MAVYFLSMATSMALRTPHDPPSSLHPDLRPALHRGRLAALPAVPHPAPVSLVDRQPVLSHPGRRLYNMDCRIRQIYKPKWAKSGGAIRSVRPAAGESEGRYGPAVYLGAA